MTERLLDPLHGVLRDVLIESARHHARNEDALDGRVIDDAEGCGVAEREHELVGGVALAKEQDLTGLSAPDSRWALAHQREELGRLLAHVGEGDAKLIKVDRAPALRRRV